MAKLSALAAEFAGLMRLQGWNQSETARRLFITPSHVNQVCNCKAEPSPAMVQLLKLTALRLRPGLKAKMRFQEEELPGGAEDLAALADLTVADEFWEVVKRRRLKKMTRAQQIEFLSGLAKILGVPFNPK